MVIGKKSMKTHKIGGDDSGNEIFFAMTEKVLEELPVSAKYYTDCNLRGLVWKIQFLLYLERYQQSILKINQRNLEDNVIYTTFEWTFSIGNYC